MHYLFIAHQVEPETAAVRRGEQGAGKARDDPVLGHCGFLARQYLGVDATLTPAVAQRAYHFLFCASDISFSHGWAAHEQSMVHMGHMT